MGRLARGAQPASVARAVAVSLLWASSSSLLILLNKHILTTLSFPFPLFLGW